MKRCFSMIAALALLVSLSACKSAPSSEEEFPVLPEFLLLDEDIQMGMKEGDVVELYGDGTRSELSGNISSMRHYTTLSGTYYSDEQPMFIQYVPAYGFTKENALTVCMYQYNLESLSGSAVGAFLEDVEAMLTQTYGEPTTKGEKWFDTTYQDDPGMLKQAIADGHYQRVTLWQTDAMTIVFNVKNEYVVYTDNENEIGAAMAEAARLS